MDEARGAMLVGQAREGLAHTASAFSALTVQTDPDEIFRCAWHASRTSLSMFETVAALGRAFGSVLGDGVFDARLEQIVLPTGSEPGPSTPAQIVQAAVEALGQLDSLLAELEAQLRRHATEQLDAGQELLGDDALRAQLDEWTAKPGA